MSNSLKKYIFIILGICIFWLGGIPLILSAGMKIVAENMSYNSDYNIKIVNPKLITSILPTATLKASEIDISAKNSNEKLHIIKPRIRIRLLPLLSGHVHINKISASNIYIESKILEKPELDKDFMSEIKKAKFVCDAVKVAKFDIQIDDTENKNRIFGENVYYRKNGRYLKAGINSTITSNTDDSVFNAKLFLPKNNDIQKSDININVENLNLKPIADFLKNYLPSDLINVSGNIDIEADKNHMTAQFKKCAINMEDSAKSMIFPDILKVNSDFNITRKTISIEQALLESDNIHAHLSGNVSNYLDRPLPSINLNISLDKSRIEDFISMAPPFKTEDIDMYKLKKYKFFGNIIGNFSVKGDNLEPSVNGQIFVDDGILTKPIPNTKGATVKLDFLGKYLDFDVAVPASSTEKVWVKGGVELYNVKYSDMRVWSTEHVDLATAEEKVVPIHEILNFVIGPVPLMDIKGDGNIDITVKGNRKDPHVWGNLNFYNVTTNFNDIPNMVMNKGVALLSFDDENAEFHLKEGLVNGKKINIDGVCNLAGKFDFNVSSQDQEVGYLYNAITTSLGLIDDIKAVMPKLDSKEGLINLRLKVFGNLKEIELAKFGKNFFTSGEINFLGNTFGLNGIKVHNTKGSAKFNGTNVSADIKSFIGNSPLDVKAIIKENLADIDMTIPKLNINDVLNAKNHSIKNYGNIITSVGVKYKGKINEIEPDKIDFTASILGSSQNNKLNISGGEITLKKGKLSVKNIKGVFIDTKSSFETDLTAENLNNKPLFNGKINLKNFDLAQINFLSNFILIPQKYRDMINLIHFNKGKINLNAVIRNNDLNASTNIGGIAFIFTPLNLPVKVVNGSIYVRKNYLGLNKINILADEMPVLLDGEINNIFTEQNFNLYFNSKPKQDFVDKYINNNRIYPVKIKGDIVYQAKLKGTKDDFNLILTADMAKDSSIYYLGATVGDVENALVLNLDMNVLNKNIIKIKEFSYDKLIDSLGTRQTRHNMLKASGGIEVYKDDLVFHDLHIKTQNPTDAKIFNIIFRKPNIKQGQFTSDLRFNGKLSNPRLIGTFHIFETDIPFLDITMKNISCNFRDKTIDIFSAGEIMGNDIKFKGTLRNKLTKPYYIENAELFTKEIDLNYITNKVRMAQVDSYQTLDTKFDLSDLIVKNLKITSNVIRLRNLVAQNVEAIISITDKKALNINKFKFNIADGNLKGDFSYNFVNNNIGLNLSAKDINANEISYAVFNLNNQIFGSLTGEMDLACNGSDYDKCMQTLNGRTRFNVSEGRIPKLGSLEYLLRAGNLVKSGITSISINSVIDIITPLKTGNFSDIYGGFSIKNGITNDIEIATKGKDLSLFISGKYNFATANADMEVLGLLSKKISTMFGPLGNVSLNTLFNVIPGVDLTKDSKILNNINKIPGIELSEKTYRKFLAVIKGNINGDDYVTSFRWIN
ncbi:hypothetical protein IKQ21_05175 [bacterium]|nr:hypothetical protein [bacterium]